jgi:hypothetical protein
MKPDAHDVPGGKLHRSLRREPNPHAVEGQAVGPTTAQVRALWEECVDGVLVEFAVRELTVEEALDLVVPVMTGRVPPGDEREMASVVFEHEFARRTRDGVEFLTAHAIGELDELETEFCLRAASLGAVVAQGARFADQEIIDGPFFLALAGIARSANLLGTIVSLAEAENYAPCSILYRSIFELWVYVTLLFEDPEYGFELLIANHKWMSEADDSEDPFLKVLASDVTSIRARRPNLRAAVERVERNRRGKPLAGLLDRGYRDVFSPLSSMFVHTSLSGLMRHIEMWDGVPGVSALEKSDNVDHATRVLVPAIALSDMCWQASAKVDMGETSKRVQELRAMTPSALKRWIEQGADDV